MDELASVLGSGAHAIEGGIEKKCAEEQGLPPPPAFSDCCWACYVIGAS